MCHSRHDEIVIYWCGKLTEKWHLMNWRTVSQGKLGKPELLVIEDDINMRKHLTEKNSTEVDILVRCWAHQTSETRELNIRQKQPSSVLTHLLVGNGVLLCQVTYLRRYNSGISSSTLSTLKCALKIITDQRHIST